MKIGKMIAGVLAGVLALGVCACGEKELPEATVENVTISQSEAAILIDNTLTLTATVGKSNGATNSNVKWETSNLDIVTVDSGVVTALSLGRAIVTAKSTEDESKVATCNVEVISETSISINYDHLNIVVGKGSVQLNGTIKKLDGTISKDLEWSSSNETIVSVDKNGLVTPKASGSAVITAKANDGENDLTAVCPVVSYATTEFFPDGVYNDIIYTLQAENNETLGYSVKARNKDITTIDILDTYNGLDVREIEAEGFKECYKLTKFVNLGANITKIGANAFSAYTETIRNDNGSLTHIDHKMDLSKKLNATISLNANVVMAERAFEDSFFTQIIMREGLETIPAYCFAGATIKTVEFPTTLKSIKGYAFAGCSRLKTAVMTSTLLENIGGTYEDDGIVFGSSFFQCGVLTDVGALPATLKTLEAYSFSGCSNLQTIALSEGLTKIGAQCFQNCATIGELTIPSTVSFVGESAFGRWSAEQTITVKAEKTPDTWHSDWSGESCKAVLVFEK